MLGATISSSSTATPVVFSQVYIYNSQSIYGLFSLVLCHVIETQGQYDPSFCFESFGQHVVLVLLPFSQKGKKYKICS